MGVAGHRRIVVQPGGVTLGFVLHLVYCLLNHFHIHVLFVYTMQYTCFCLQCFDAVGWAAGRASGL